jgi:hypothetical protein
MFNVQEIANLQGSCRIISSGSKSEGLDVEGSDMVTTQTILIAYLRGKYLHQVEQLTGIASHSYIPDLWEYLPP